MGHSPDKRDKVVIAGAVTDAENDVHFAPPRVRGRDGAPFSIAIPQRLHAALIEMPSRPATPIFGLSLLVRLVLCCQRVGAQRIYVGGAGTTSAKLPEAHPFVAALEIEFVASLDSILRRMGPHALCLRIHGNPVLSPFHLERLLDLHRAHPDHAVSCCSAAGGGCTRVEVGTSRQLLEGAPRLACDVPTPALDGTVAAHDVELSLARELPRQTAAKDAPLARMIDRRLSWRISLEIARNAITPNQVTVAATIVGLLSAVLFAIPAYSVRLAAAALFLASTTLDGVDGEVARLKFAESRFGAHLDTLTDNLVHLCLFVGIMIGCYRASARSAYLVLIAVMLGGMITFYVAGQRARRVDGPAAKAWLDHLEQLTGRDFAYVLLLLALVDHLEYFAWGASLGAYVVAMSLWRATTKRLRSHELTATKTLPLYDNRGLLDELDSLLRARDLPPPAPVMRRL